MIQQYLRTPRDDSITLADTIAPYRWLPLPWTTPFFALPEKRGLQTLAVSRSARRFVA